MGLGLREIIAKRLTNIQKAGMQIPIINELPLPAKIIFIDSFTPPTFPTIPIGPYQKELQAFIDHFKNFPATAHGTAFGEEAGRWYRVTYPHAMRNATPIAIGKARLTSIPFREIVRVKRDDFNSTYYCNLVASGARDRAKLLAPPWPLDIIWGWFCDTLVYAVFFAGWLTSGWILNTLWDSFIQPQVDKVRDSVNMRLDDLYNAWGVPMNMALTPLHIRNADANGFEFQSYGQTTCYWFSIGKMLQALG